MKKYIMLTFLSMLCLGSLTAYNRDYDRQAQDNWLRNQAQDAERYRNENNSRRGY